MQPETLDIVLTLVKIRPA